jgi:hypothetical protein
MSQGGRNDVRARRHHHRSVRELVSADSICPDGGGFLSGQIHRTRHQHQRGWGYDLYARMVARHMGKHIPGNPTILPKNMEGGGGMRLANWLYNVAPKDGTVLGALARATALEPLLGNKSAQYDGTKFNYIGSANDEVSVCVAWYTRRCAGRRLHGNHG